MISNITDKNEKPNVILAGDIGGTKTNLDLFAYQNGKLSSFYQASFKSKEFKSLQDIVRCFLENNNHSIEKACFGIAGPILNDHCKIPNLPWTISRSDLQACLGIKEVSLLNDLEATAHGVLHLEENESVTLKAGKPDEKGTIAIIAAGTGLGEAFLYWDGHKYHVAASEGGHSDFAPRTEIEIALLAFLLKKYDHVSYEMALSGPGISNIYDFLREYRDSKQSEWLKQRMRQGDKNAVITQAALEGKDDVCTETLDLFTTIYGAEAGNLALKVKAIGGVYVCGGIAPKIINKLTDGSFVTAFLHKGRLSGMLENIPIRVVMNEKTAILGAAYFAANCRKDT